MGFFKGSSVIKKGTWISLALPDADGSLTLTSAQPMNGSFVPLTAVKSSSMFNSSDTLLTFTCGKCSFRVLFVSIDTWAPVSHKTINSVSFRKHFTLHSSPTRPIILSCCLGCRWLANTVSLIMVSGVDNCFIVLQTSLCWLQSLFWHSLEQYPTVLHCLHSFTTVLLVTDLPQKLHRWDTLVDPTTSGPGEAAAGCLTVSEYLVTDDIL